MSRRAVVLAGVIGAGMATALAAHFTGFSGRPPATGDVGVLYAYGQVDGQPTRLRPGVRQDLTRPQRIAFEFSAEGTGPRYLRIELDDGVRRWVMHEEPVAAPAREDGLGYFMRLDDSVRDRVEIIVTVEAPHAKTVTSRLPIRLLPRVRE